MVLSATAIAVRLHSPSSALQLAPPQVVSTLASATAVSVVVLLPQDAMPRAAMVRIGIKIFFICMNFATKIRISREQSQIYLDFAEREYLRRSQRYE